MDSTSEEGIQPGRKFGGDPIMQFNPVRRKLLKVASFMAIPTGLSCRSSHLAAMTNGTARAQLQYQDAPKGAMNCASCLEFLPGKGETDLGGCKKIPGDDEISPNGYCIVWNTM